MKKTITNTELSGLTMELYLLLHAGVGVGDALALLEQEETYKDLLAGMSQQADSGAPLSACLRESGRFPAYLCGLIEVGEGTGRTEEALSALSRYYEQRARLTQALSMGIARDLPLEKALELSASLLSDNPAAQARCRSCCEQLDQGVSLAQAMRASALLPASACRLLELGQRSGSADMAMEKIARDLADDSDAAIEELVSRVEPALVLVCSVLVGLILLSVMLPLMHIMSAIG